MSDWTLENAVAAAEDMVTIATHATGDVMVFQLFTDEEGNHVEIPTHRDIDDARDRADAIREDVWKLPISRFTPPEPLPSA
jgi:hypothetical protein